MTISKKSVGILLALIIVYTLFAGLVYISPNVCPIGITSATSAPAFYDDFSDGQYQNRTGTDQWDRPLPNWAVESGSWDASNGYLTVSTAGQDQRISMPINSSQGGTLELDWYYVSSIPYVFLEDDSGNSFYFNWFASDVGDSHFFAQCSHAPYPAIPPYSNIYASRQLFKNEFNDASSGHHKAFTNKWYKTIIVLRSQDNGTLIELYETDSLDVDDTAYMMPRSKVWDMHTVNISKLVLRTENRVGGVRFDNITFYANWYYDGYGVKYTPSTNTIEVRGRNHTLQTISDFVNNPSVFNYVSSEKTAYCYATIQLDGGASLNINDQTLIMHPDSHGGQNILLKNLFVPSSTYAGNSEFYVTNSTIKAGTSYRWDFESYDGALIRVTDSNLTNVNTFTWRASNFLMTNSTLEYYSILSRSHKSEMDRYLLGVSIENCTLNRKYSGGSTGICEFDDAPNFYHLGYDGYTSSSELDHDKVDPVFKNCNFINPGTIYLMYAGQWSFQNVANISTFDSAYSGGWTQVNYYLDVLVTDINGVPISDATVTVTNEVDLNYPSKDYNGNTLNSVTTGAKGHTPLPTEDEDNTFVITDFKADNPTTYTIDYYYYTYTITAEKDGYTATVTVTPDESWYREDPNTYPGPGKGTVFITLPLTTAPSLNITNINATAITSNTATITWATDKESDTKVTYTTNPSTLGTHWQNDSSQTLTHTIPLSELEIDTPYYFMVYSTDTAGNTANSTVSNFSTSAALPDNATTVTIQSPNDVTDNRLKEASPDTVLGSTSFIDIGRINTEGNYRDVIWFNLTQLNTTAVIKTAKLSLFWYYVTDTRNISTTVEIYRPVAWADNYVTWNTRTNGVAWDNLGGDWYDTMNVAQGTTPYAAVTFPVGAADNVYHEFDVTELVQSYVDGHYENTGFFIKANEVSNSYIAFRSSDWTNASERPKLVVSYGGGDAQQNTLSGAVTSPCGTDIANATVTLTTRAGAEINTTQTDSTGHYAFANVDAGFYDITATKRSYWSNTNNVTVTAEAPETADIVLCQKGDFNTNSEPADAGDLAMMADATVAGTSDETYDLDGDGNPADEADLTLLKDVSVGVAELE